MSTWITKCGSLGILRGHEDITEVDGGSCWDIINHWGVIGGSFKRVLWEGGIVFGAHAGIYHNVHM